MQQALLAHPSLIHIQKRREREVSAFFSPLVLLLFRRLPWRRTLRWRLCRCPRQSRRRPSRRTRCLIMALTSPKVKAWDQTSVMGKNYPSGHLRRRSYRVTDAASWDILWQSVPQRYVTIVADLSMCPVSARFFQAPSRWLTFTGFAVRS